MTNRDVGMQGHFGARSVGNDVLDNGGLALHNPCDLERRVRPVGARSCRGETRKESITTV
jgi:hypothetical protein